MKVRPNDRRLLAAGLALSTLIAGFIAWGRVRTVEVPDHADWESVPLLCPQPGVDGAALLQAVRWWREQGHELTLSCDQWTVWIGVDATIDTRDSVEDIGTTHGWTALAVQDGIARSAEVRVLPGSDALVYAHELGHVLGYAHPRAAPTGHLMHPRRPGWDGRGLAASPQP
jgi:hypothetical protein